MKALCSNCGWDKSAMDKECIARYIQEHGDMIVRYQQCGKERHTETSSSVDTATTDVYGQKQKNRDEVQKIWHALPLPEFFLVYQKESAAFFEHRELAHWQADQFDKCVHNLPEHHIAILIDYSMNYSHNHFTAVQGMGMVVYFQFTCDLPVQFVIL